MPRPDPKTASTFLTFLSLVRVLDRESTMHAMLAKFRSELIYAYIYIDVVVEKHKLARKEPRSSLLHCRSALRIIARCRKNLIVELPVGFIAALPCMTVESNFN